MVTIKAPAKINLTMEVLGKRPDGYHEIRSVIQTLNLCDVLRFTETGNVAVRSHTSGWDADLSLVSKAVELVRQTTGHPGGVDIDVEKHIPMTAGLGGDSSDAAAVLRGLKEMWSLDLPQEKLLGMAAQLGSDVSFFLYGGTCLMAGRGEKVTPLPALPARQVILINPDVPHISGKTAFMYAGLKPSHFTDGSVTERLVQDIRAGLPLSAIHLFNTFENIAFDLSEELATYKSHITKLGASNVHLAGSGAALFVLPEDARSASDICTRVIDQGMEAYLLETGKCD